MAIPGYAGKILFVDLSDGSTETEPLDDRWAKEYLGGWGINYRLAYDLAISMSRAVNRRVFIK